MASVGKRGKSCFVRFRVDDGASGETHIRKSGFRTKENAWAATKELERKSNAGIDIHGDQVSCGAIMERWFDEHCFNLAEAIKSKYSDEIERLSRTFIYNLPVRKLNATALCALIANLLAGEGGKVKLSPRMAVSITEPLRLSISWASQNGIIPINSISQAKLPQIAKRQQKILNDSDIDDIVAQSAGSAFRVPLLLALYGGLRREEAAELQWSSVDFKRRTISVLYARTRTTQGKEVEKNTKTISSRRTINMPRFVMDELHEVAKPSDYVCVSRTGAPYKLDCLPQATRRLIQSINKKRKGTGIPPMPQASYLDLRHTHAAMLIRMGVQPKVIQERLGHASIKITMDTYGYLMTGS